MEKVKVLNSQGVATQAGPESGIVESNLRGEALTGEGVGQG